MDLTFSHRAQIKLPIIVFNPKKWKSIICWLAQQHALHEKKINQLIQYYRSNGILKPPKSPTPQMYHLKKLLSA